nr:condensin complex subunit 3 [Ipomoea batatas]
MLDFSNASNRRVAGEFLQELLHKPLDYELNEHENKVVIGVGSCYSNILTRRYAAPTNLERLLAANLKVLTENGRLVKVVINWPKGNLKLSLYSPVSYP